MKKHLLRVFFFTAAFSVAFYSRTNVSGPGAGYTNAPSEDACNASGCHMGTSLQTSGTLWNKIKLTGNFTGSGYIPDSTYTLYLTYKEATKTRIGYQITALDGTNSPAGTFSTVDSRSQTYTQTISGKTRSYAGHTSSGTSTVTTDSFAWAIKWTAPKKNVGKISFYITLNSTNNSGNSAGDVVYAKVIQVSPSSLLPYGKIFIKDSVYCSGIALTFAADTSAGITGYQWSFPGSGVSIASSKAVNPQVTYAFTGTYKAYLTTTNSKGVGQPDTFTFAVVQGATSPTITPAGTTNLCKGDTLNVSVSTPATGHTYLWSNGATTRSMNVTDSGNYTVTVRNNNKCFRTSNMSANVRMIDKPELKILHSFSGDTACAGTMFFTGALVLKGTIDSFSYASAKGPFKKSDSIQDIIYSGSKSYTVWGKGTNGCISPPSSVTLYSKAKTSAPVLASDSIDYTGFIVNWNAIPNATGYKVSIDSGKTFIDPTSGSKGLKHHITGLLGNHTMKVLVYALTKDLCGVSDIGEISVTTLTCTSLPFTVEASSYRVCKGSTVQFTLRGLENKKIAVQINGNNVGSDTIQNVTISGTNGYSVGVLDSAALICGYSFQNVTVVEDTVLTPTWNIPVSNHFCSNSSSVNFATAINANNTVDSVFFWKNNATESRGKTLQHTYTVSDGDSLWVVTKNSGGCVSLPGQKSYISIDSIPDATFDSSNVHFDYTFTANDNTGTHTWDIDGVPFAGPTVNVDLTGSVNRKVKVRHTISKNGCSSTDSAIVFVPDFASITVPGASAARLYPNPAGSQFTVEMIGLKGNAEIQLTNSLGQVVLKQPIHAGANTIQTHLLQSGIYTYRITTAQGKTSGNLVIKK